MARKTFKTWQSNVKKKPIKLDKAIRNLLNHLRGNLKTFNESLDQYETRMAPDVLQPHVPPSARGYAKSVVDRYVIPDQLSCDAYFEAVDLPDQVKQYKARFDFYPEVVFVGGIDKTREIRT